MYKKSGYVNQVSQPAADQYGVKKNAASGAVINGFPTTLQLDATAKVEQSFYIPYKGAGQYTTTFTSSKSVADEYQAYLDYASANGFTLLSKGLDTKTNSAHFYAIKDKVDLNVTISSQNHKTEISVSYLQK